MIAQEALGLLARQGIQGMSIAELADRVGLVPSGIYRHFKGKEDILDAVFELLGSRLKAILDAATESSSNSIEALERLFHSHVRLLQENPGIPRIVFSEGIFSDDAHRKGKVWEIVRAYLDGVSEIIRAGQEERSVRLDLEPNSGAIMFLGLIQPLIILIQVTEGAFDVESHVRVVWPMFLEMVTAGSSQQAFGHNTINKGKNRRRGE
jgi:AcrR family transcriptional regulator